MKKTSPSYADLVLAHMAMQEAYSEIDCPACKDHNGEITITYADGSSETGPCPICDGTRKAPDHRKMKAAFMGALEKYEDPEGIYLGNSEFLPDSEVISAVNKLYEIGQSLVDDPNPGPCTHDDGKDLIRIAEALDIAADDPTEDKIRALEKAMKEVDSGVRDYIPDYAFEVIIKLDGWK